MRNDKTNRNGSKDHTWAIRQEAKEARRQLQQRFKKIGKKVKDESKTYTPRYVTHTSLDGVVTRYVVPRGVYAVELVTKIMKGEDMSMYKSFIISNKSLHNQR